MELDYSSDSITVMPIDGIGDARIGCHQVKQIANELEFTPLQREQLQIAVKEITNNMITHKAIKPSLSIYKIRQADKSGISLVATDHGPGIPSISTAMADRSSSQSSMGCGLGAIRRLMDEFAIHSKVPEDPHNLSTSYSRGGTTIITSKWCETGASGATHFQWGGISRPMPGYYANGDAFFLKETDHTIHIFIADGLGHGSQAALASQQAIRLARKNFNLPFDTLFPLLHRALRPTRGVALMAIRLDKQAHTLSYCGIGNIEASLLPRQISSPLSRPGVLGSGKLPVLINKTLAWPDNGMLVLHTDGVSRRWSDDSNIQLQKLNPLLLSHLLLRDYGRYSDDAAVLILKENKPHG